MALFFRDILENCTEEFFLHEVILKYHYLPEDKETLRRTAERMREQMLPHAVWEHRLFRGEDGCPMAEVAMTLGEGVDELQAEYTRQELLSESYMLETLGSEILLRGYAAYNAWVADHTVYYVKGYSFPETGGRYALEVLPEMLKRLNMPVICNEALCMLPKKSVAFYAVLTEEAGTACPGICMGCGRRDCPNHMDGTIHRHWNFADMTDRPLPYGYTRIFGGREVRSQAE